MYGSAARAGETVAVKVGRYLEFQAAIAGDILVFVLFPQYVRRFPGPFLFGRECDRDCGITGNGGTDGCQCRPGDDTTASLVGLVIGGFIARQ